MFTRKLASYAVVSIGLVAGLAACRKEPAGDTQASMKAAKPAAPAVESQSNKAAPELAAILAKADAMDGTIDHVVSKCGMCALRMDGSDAHVSKVGEYELHFCSDHCKESFDGDAEKAVLALNVK